MPTIKEIINEEIMNTVANYPSFADRLNLNEIGDGSVKQYPFTFDDVSQNEVNYNFDTEEDEYVVIITNTDMYSGIWEMQFGTVGGTPKDVVNKGRIFNVMTTILQIANDFLGKYMPNVIKFKPEKNEVKQDDKRRFNLYMEYVKKNMRADYFAYEYGEYIIIERKVKIKSNIPKI
jgi:hypothetical protein